MHHKFFHILVFTAVLAALTFTSNAASAAAGPKGTLKVTTDSGRVWYVSAELAKKFSESDLTEKLRRAEEIAATGREKLDNPEQTNNIGGPTPGTTDLEANGWLFAMSPNANGSDIILDTKADLVMVISTIPAAYWTSHGANPFVWVSAVAMGLEDSMGNQSVIGYLDNPLNATLVANTEQAAKMPGDASVKISNAPVITHAPIPSAGTCLLNVLTSVTGTTTTQISVDVPCNAVSASVLITKPKPDFSGGSFSWALYN